VGAVSTTPDTIMFPRSAPKPPSRPNTVGMRIRPATADILLVITSKVKTPMDPKPNAASMYASSQL
jgi:hypothetical protein